MRPGYWDTDASTNEIMGNIYRASLDSRKNINGFNIALLTYNLDEWNNPIVQERLKDSYYILKDRFQKY